MQLGHAIEVVHAELLPEDKAKLIKEFKREGPSAMIGDGLNDAPALATADIGISMGISGSALASETGHVILLSNDIRKIPKAIKLARKARRKVIQNVFLSISTKAAILVLAIVGHPLVWAAVLADVGTCLLVILNSMLLLQETHTHRGKCCKSSSSATHVHKHGCNDSHSRLKPHKDQQCCSNNKALKVCQSQECSSRTNVSKCQARPSNLSSCCEKKCGNSGDMHNDSASSNKFHESQHCHHGSFNTANHDLESQNMHDHSCLGSETLGNSCFEENHHVKNSIGRRSCSANGDHHGHHDSSHCNHSLAESQKSTSSGQCNSSCHGKSHINNGSIHKAAEPICDHIHHYHHEVDSCLEKHGKDHTASVVIQGGNHAESEAIHVCMMSSEKRELEGCCGNHKEEFPTSVAMNTCISLEKREMGGCCKSYMKECCSKHGHFGAPLGGGLSEVIID